MSDLAAEYAEAKAAYAVALARLTKAKAALAKSKANAAAVVHASRTLAEVDALFPPSIHIEFRE